MQGLRVVLVGLGALLGLVLLTRGFVVIGAILLVMAVVRAAMVATAHRRRNERVARRQAMGARWQASRGAGPRP